MVCATCASMCRVLVVSLVFLVGCRDTKTRQAEFLIDGSWNRVVQSVRVKVALAEASDAGCVAATGAAVNEFLAPVWLHWVVQKTRSGVPFAVHALDFADTSRFFNDRLSGGFPEDGFGGLEAAAARKWLASQEREAVNLRVKNLVFETRNGRTFDCARATTAQRVAFLKELANFRGEYPGSAYHDRR